MHDVHAQAVPGGVRLACRPCGKATVLPAHEFDGFNAFIEAHRDCQSVSVPIAIEAMARALAVEPRAR
jgi:hypothetical protein